MLKTKLYDKSKKCALKIFALHPSPLDTCLFWKKHPREKWQKVDHHYFSILEGVYFWFLPLNFIQKLRKVDSFIFLQSAFLKRFGFQGGLPRFSKNTFWNCHIIKSSKIWIIPSIHFCQVYFVFPLRAAQKVKLDQIKFSFIH